MHSLLVLILTNPLLLLLLLLPQALGKVMGAELPHVPGGSDIVLYPASVKASTDLQDSLAAAGFTVQRINTYNTVSRAEHRNRIIKQQQQQASPCSASTRTTR
jgi:uroporphyrinogen-III synthase